MELFYKADQLMLSIRLKSGRVFGLMSVCDIRFNKIFFWFIKRQLILDGTGFNMLKAGHESLAILKLT